jgi:hypothetical protein
MTDAEFDTILKQYVADFLGPDKKVVKGEIRFNMLPFLGHLELDFGFTKEEAMSPEFKKKIKYLSRNLSDKLELYHRHTTNNGLNKWNRAIFTLDAAGHVTRKFIWDEEFEKENLASNENGTGQVRQKWYWET